MKKLSVTLAQANPKDDHDEVERRSELAKFVSCLTFLVDTESTLYYRELEEIGLQSLALLAKGKTARVLDKTRDSGEVIKLVERLRQATLIYQVGIRMLSWFEIADKEIRCHNRSQYTTNSLKSP